MTPVAVRLTENVNLPERVKGGCQAVAPLLHHERAAELAGVHRALAAFYQLNPSMSEPARRVPLR